MASFEAFDQKMRAAGMGDAAIRAFRRNYEALCRNETGLIPESDIGPAENLPDFSNVAEGAPADASLLGQAVVIKLNGGLGTSMGLQGPKSLLPVRDGVTFLDLMVRQVQSLRESTGARVRLLLMNSFNTSEGTLEHLQRYKADGFAEASEVELLQNQIPKIDAGSLQPVEWSTDADLEWCPPGHGDLFPALVGSGWLDRLLAEGVKYAFVSNSDNLGAVLDPSLLRYFAESGAPFLMEVTRRTAADRKGGHLAKRKSDGRLLLREVAQCPDADLEAFQNIDRHQYFNTNSLWLRLDLLKEQLAADDGVLPLPMIRNRKTVDPRDKNSPAVLQLEVAMGAAIECFEGSTAIEVPRSRFAPVKTTGDLFSLRSDAYEVLEDGQVRLAAQRDGVPPVVSLGDSYKLVDQLEELGAVPSLLESRSLDIQGRVTFEAGVAFAGDVSIQGGQEGPKTLSAGRYEGQQVVL
ncbi:UTP--glucose-1-phosphate uridylyltransferase [Luteolibacter ambystomatis]|uniref:UTP--glucose-1-phosphate uridylyltransferase n=1 Tax=Luteolibacter ambystomatis TaxID=2824561 RepID=A0A975J1Z8_9BACT|nr:UTP--glucose-1-phosphate uridylyltransferase [Luteolibacter ambystomatis]QUE52517.1 UTP--glucose-1-phosphate uridylyltransferase [Luteolibacter ambystomatis]